MLGGDEICRDGVGGFGHDVVYIVEFSMIQESLLMLIGSAGGSVSKSLDFLMFSQAMCIDDKIHNFYIHQSDQFFLLDYH
jgi:hypothetical protein